MKETKKSGCLSTIGSVFQGIDAARRLVMNVLFLLVLLLLLNLLKDPIPTVPSKAALVLAPQGVIVEQQSGDAVARAVAEWQGANEPQTLLVDLLDAIELAQEDDRIEAILLNLNYFQGGGLNLQREVHAALNAFRGSGKKVIAAADYYTRSAYYLASAADEIYLNEEGFALIDGFGVFPTYYKNAIDRLGIRWNVFKAGKYKSAVEPYTLEEMAPHTRDSTLEWLNDLWQIWLSDVAEARNLPVDVLDESLENYDIYVEKADGYEPQALVQAGLIDVLGGRQDIRDRMTELVGESSVDPNTFSQINFWDYLLRMGAERPRSDQGGDAVGVIVASGSILDGEQGPGTIGGYSTANLIREARLDDSIQALLMRVDSGGGSQFASEIIRQELELLTDAGKPFVVSMSSMTASGAYWFATEADEIWASETTLTGSIGIYAMIPTFETPLKEIGVNIDGVGVNWMADAMRVDRDMHPRLKGLLMNAVDRDYDQFLQLVADARGMTVEEVDDIAQGRVWSGVDALEIGLVDHLGSFQQALDATAARTDLGEDYSVRYLEPQLGLKDQVLLQFLARAATIVEPVARQLKRPSLFDQGIGRFLAEQGKILSRFNDPRGIYAHCQCEIAW